MLLGASVPAAAQVSISIRIQSYPDFVRVPDYPVYYAPRLDSNLFFYDGLYWVLVEDRWYESSWYDGPWDMVDREYVPLFVLRVPVRYYRRPPNYFRGWRPDAPPRWGEHWGSDWQRRHGDWDRWDRASAPPPAPLPMYQRQYSGDHYPRGDQQQSLRNQHYRYEPRDPVVRQHYEQPPRRQVPAQPPREQATGQRPGQNERKPQYAPPAPQRSAPEKRQESRQPAANQSDKAHQSADKKHRSPPQQGKPDAKDQKGRSDHKSPSGDARSPDSKEQTGKPKEQKRKQDSERDQEGNH
jgi:hypothetical protein